MKVLWLSRHYPLPAQERELKRIYGPDTQIIVHPQPIPTAEHAIQLARSLQCEVIVPVLPLSFIMRLVEAAKKEKITLLWAQMKELHVCDESCPADPDCEVKLPNYTGVEYRHLRFVGFKIIEGVELKLRDID